MPSPPPWSAGQPTACRRARPAGSSPPLATGRSTGCAGRPHARTGTRRRPCCTPGTNRRRKAPVRDERLRLIFTCCHPALSRSAQVALTLRLLGGLTTAEIARAFLVPESTLAQRLVRAKGKIRDARIPYRVPAAAELAGRLQSVLAVVYLVFNEGYARQLGSGARPRGPVRGGRPPRPAARRAHARGAGGPGPARADAARPVASGGPDHRRRRARAAQRSGSGRAGTARSSPRARRSSASACGATQPGVVPDPGGDWRRAQRRALSSGHRLGADRAALRPAARRSTRARSSP